MAGGGGVGIVQSEEKAAEGAGQVEDEVVTRSGGVTVARLKQWSRI